MGAGNYDRTIYGKVYYEEVDKATLEVINDLYFKGCIPLTSEIWALPEWNHVMIFLIGSGKTWEVERWYYGFILFGEKKIPDSGFKTTNGELLEVLHKLRESVRKGCGDNYWNLQESRDQITQISD